MVISQNEAIVLFYQKNFTQSMLNINNYDEGAGVKSRYFSVYFFLKRRAVRDVDAAPILCKSFTI